MQVEAKDNHFTGEDLVGRNTYSIPNVRDGFLSIENGTCLSSTSLILKRKCAPGLSISVSAKT
jgi:hypothetical protein